MIVSSSFRPRPSSRISIRQTRKPQQRIHITKHTAKLNGKIPACRRRRCQLRTNDPRAQPLPMLRSRRPARLLFPLALLGGIPITFILPPKPLLLLCRPGRIGNAPWIRKQRQRRILIFRSRINPESRRHRLSLKSRRTVRRSLLALKRNSIFQIHLRAIRRLVFRKADVAIDARKILPIPRRRIEALI